MWNRESMNRRAFLERGTRAGIGLGAASLVARGVWVPGASSATVDEALGIGDPALQATGSQRTQTLALSNAAIAAQWNVDAGHLHFLRLAEPNGAVLRVPDDVFTIILGDGEPIRASEMRVVGTPRVAAIATTAGASRLAERLPGRQVTVQLEDFARRLAVSWRAELRDGARYIRQELTIQSSKDIRVREIMLVDLPAPGATIIGSVKGSPIIIDRWYASAEHPLAVNAVDGARVRSSIVRELPLRASTTLQLSSVIGTTRAGQLRRDFLAYVERERAHPYRPFLHYNSWYDLGYFSKLTRPRRSRSLRRSARSCSADVVSSSTRSCSMTGGTIRRRSGVFTADSRAASLAYAKRLRATARPPASGCLRGAATGSRSRIA